MFSNNSSPLVVAIDDGYAQVKIMTHDGEKLIRLVVPTSVLSSSDGVSSMDATDHDVINMGWYETEGQRFTAGAKVHGEETRFDRFHISALNRVAIHHALHSAGLSGRHIVAAAGLPVADYYHGHEINRELIARKTSSLMTPVSPLMADLNPVRIDDVKIVAQAVASWVDFAVTDDLVMRNDIDLSDPVGVIDVGGRTTDFAVVIDGRKVEHARSGTENIGVIDVRSTVSRMIVDKFNIKGKLNPSSVDAALRTGSIKLYGKPVDVTDILAAAAKPVQEQILRSVDHHFDSVADLSQILVVGGGANIFRSLGSLFPNCVLVDDPEFANVRGMLKFAMLQSKRG